MKGGLLFAALLLLLPLIHAVQEVDDAESYNRNLSDSLLGGENSCGAEERVPDAYNPFEIASISIVALLPQADNSTSDLRNVSVLWSWSAKFPQSLHYEFTTGTDSCPGSEANLYAPIGPHLAGATLDYSYGSCFRSVPLSGSGPNPVPLELPESCLREEDYGGRTVNLTVNISGRVTVTYSYHEIERKSEYAPFAEGGSACVEEDKGTVLRPFSQESSESRNFSVETGSSAVFWINPPLQTRLSGSSDAEAALFSRRLPSFVQAESDGETLGENAPFMFRTGFGRCGEKTVASEYSPKIEGLEAELSSGSFFPYQLAGDKRAYLPILLEFGWNETPGRKVASISFIDWFSHPENFSREFYVREPSPYAAEGEGEGLSVRQPDERTAAASARFPPRQAAMPDVSLLAVALAIPFALGAAALLRMWRRGQG